MSHAQAHEDAERTAQRAAIRVRDRAKARGITVDWCELMQLIAFFARGAS